DRLEGGCAAVAKEGAGGAGGGLLAGDGVQEGNLAARAPAAATVGALLLHDGRAAERTGAQCALGLPGHRLVGARDRASRAPFPRPSRGFPGGGVRAPWPAPPPPAPLPPLWLPPREARPPPGGGALPDRAPGGEP